VGGNSFWANLFASVVGAFMYFATLTEVPILQGLIGAGMGKGPALALLLAGPALSLPNMLVIRSVLGTKKTAAFVLLVVVMATISGLIFGHFFMPKKGEDHYGHQSAGAWVPQMPSRRKRSSRKPLPKAVLKPSSVKKSPMSWRLPDTGCSAPRR
jgi:hypothetical protein